MAEYAYNNGKNISTGHISFELNYGFYPPAFYKDDVNLYFPSKLSDKLANKLRVMMIVNRKNV